MEFEIRELKARDIAPMCRIASKIGIKQIADVFSDGSLKGIVAASGAGDEDGSTAKEKAERVGLSLMTELASVVCANFDKADTELFRFLASMAGMKEKEVSELSLADAFDLATAVFMSEGFSDFFKRVQASLAR